ncbi:uncharacterized protein VP01_4069g1 [Puccinia sorghi]|uniref:Uncharacterized protein n=1 Tax=Puccinia sorghi TaxID=27349 RepID=A0A0L6URI1_9BASI|nr:uncharacterized protein VP01_4069g1 [Puccinia sorghi]
MNILGYVPSQFDRSLPKTREGVVTRSNDAILQQIKQDLKDCLGIKWTQGVETIICVVVTRNANGFKLYQDKLIDKILKRDKESVARTPLPLGYNAPTDLV